MPVQLPDEENKIQIQENSMRSLSTTIGIRAILFAVALLASARGYGQGGIVPAGESSAAVREFEEGLGRFGEEYWGQKQESYRERIDRMLLAEDLALLNRLRIRWMLLSEQEKVARETPAPAASGTAAIVEFRIDEEMERNLTEMLDIFSGATRLAGSYRQELDGVGVDVMDDLSSFIDILGERIRGFQKEQPEVAARSGVASRLMVIDLWKKMGAEKSDENALLAVYPIAVEPMILLYGGTDPGALFDRMGESSGISTGVTLPENSVLRQNVPNPASSATNITWRLAEPSSAATLRLFDSRGDLQGTYDLGALPAGEHGFDLDVSSLASGSYLYHLTVRTGSGDRVYVKAMQVVH